MSYIIADNSLTSPFFTPHFFFQFCDWVSETVLEFFTLLTIRVYVVLVFSKTTKSNIGPELMTLR